MLEFLPTNLAEVSLCPLDEGGSANQTVALRGTPLRTQQNRNALAEISFCPLEKQASADQ